MAIHKFVALQLTVGTMVIPLCCAALSAYGALSSRCPRCSCSNGDRCWMLTAVACEGVLWPVPGVLALAWRGSKQSRCWMLSALAGDGVLRPVPGALALARLQTKRVLGANGAGVRLHACLCSGALSPLRMTTGRLTLGARFVV